MLRGSPRFSFNYLRDKMIFRSGESALCESVALLTQKNTSGLRRALQMGTVLGAGALILAPAAASAENYIYSGSASTGGATTSTISATTTGADTITVITTTGGTVTVSGGKAIATSAETGETRLTLGANVSGPDGIDSLSTAGGNITVQTASGVTVTATSGAAIKGVSTGGAGNILIGGVVGLGGAVSGASGIYASTTGIGTIIIKANAAVTGTSGDALTTIAETGKTTISIGSGSTVTGSISATATTGDVALTNAGTVKGSLLVGGGTGAFTFDNSGTLALSDSQSNTGFTIKNLAGGVLTGTGAFGTVNALADSIIRPGDRTLEAVGGVPVMGVLRTGNLTLASGAKVEVRADYVGGSDYIAVTGTAALGGATLKILATPNNEKTWIAGPKTFTVLTATGAISGTFASVTTEYAFLSATANYAANSVTATLERNTVKFVDVATTRLQASVGGALDSFASQSANPLIQKITTLTRLEAPAALQQLAGAGLNSTHSQAFGASRLVIDTVSAEMGRFTGSAGGGAALSYVEDTRIKTPAFKDVAPKVEPIADARIWAQMMGGVGVIKANEGSGAPAERASTYGVAAGVDRAFNPNLRVGFALAGGKSTLKVAALSTKSDATWGQAALYAVATDGALYAKTSLTMGYIANETERTVTAFSTPEKATGEFSALLYAARVEIGQRFELKPAGVTPFLAFEPSLVAQNAYSEKAATPIALGFSKSTANALPGTLGVKFDVNVDLGQIRLTPSATLGWVHNFANATTISPFFTALPGSTFSVTGVEGDRDLARAELNLEATRYGSLASVFANARADYGQRTNSLRGTGGMMVRF